MGRLQASSRSSVATYETRAVDAATRALTQQLEVIAAAVRDQAPSWRDDPAAAMRGRRELAAALRRVRPGAARGIRSQIPGAVRVATSKKITIDPRSDDLVDRCLRDVDRQVRAKAQIVARLLTQETMQTDRQAQRMAERILAVASPAESAASQVVVRVSAMAALASTGGSAPMVWVTEPGACHHCLEMAGATSRDGRFRRRVRYADTDLPWATDGVVPPLHPSCRCHLVPATGGLADELAAEAARTVAEGRSGHASNPAKMRAARRLVASRARLKPAIRRKAAILAKGKGT